jgi:hypothetical protein
MPFVAASHIAAARLRRGRRSVDQFNAINRRAYGRAWVVSPGGCGDEGW